MSEQAKIPVEVIRKAFFEGMKRGWISDEGWSSRKISGHQTTITVEVKLEGFTLEVVDYWYSNPEINFKSYGTTTIWCGKTLLWIMTYGGEYPPFVIPFLKDSLRKAYEVEEFCGGRGQKEAGTAESGPMYMNTIIENDFESFSGAERIILPVQGSVGYHWYRGMIVI